MKFNEWLDTFVEEKCFDMDTLITVDGPSGENMIPLGDLLSTIKGACKEEKEEIKNLLVKIDFVDGNCMHFFKYLAGAIAI